MTRQTGTDIYTSDAKPGDVLIQLTHPRSNTGSNRADLTIRDQMSGQTLIHVSLSAEQFLDLMSSTGTLVSGAHLPVHAERIGKRSQNVSTTLSHGSELTAEQVRDDYLAEGWESVRIDRTNFGKRVVAYRWINDDAADAQRVAEGS